MSKLSRALEFNRKTRAIIYDRDKYKCVIPGCTNTFGLGVAHVFFSRAKGGLGVKENGVLLCQHHHGLLDNGRNGELSQQIQRYCEEYLRTHYDINTKDLVYNKYKGFKY